MSRMFKALILLACSVVVSGCATLQPPAATGPRGTNPLYPILLREDDQRKEATLAALKRLTRSAGNSSASEPKLQPITGTILSLPDGASSVLYLPKVGAAPVMTEEETRESLRRFIIEWQDLIGAEPSRLSLVERTDQPDGSKLANYEQRPFRHPMRGNYGKLQIRFTADRRVLDLSSTCIPDADRIQNGLPSASSRIKVEDAVQQLRAKGFTYTDVAGAKVTFAVPPSSQLTPRELTTYILPSKTAPDALEFHLAWEIDLSNAPVKTAYVDALSGEIIATQ